MTALRNYKIMILLTEESNDSGLKTWIFKMTALRKYEIMILLTGEFNDSELKTWVFNYAKNLRKFNVCDISVISRGKHNLSYSIDDRTKGNYIQLNFASTPKYISNFSNILKLDSHVLRFSVFNKQK